MEIRTAEMEVGNGIYWLTLDSRGFHGSIVVIDSSTTSHCLGPIIMKTSARAVS